MDFKKWLEATIKTGGGQKFKLNNPVLAKQHEKLSAAISKLTPEQAAKLRRSLSRNNN